MENNDNNHFMIDLPINEPEKTNLIMSIINLQPSFNIPEDKFWEFVNDFIYDMTDGRTITIGGEFGEKMTLPVNIKDLSLEELKKVYEYLTKDLRGSREYVEKYG